MRERTHEPVRLPGADRDTSLILDEPRRRRGRRNVPTAQLSLSLPCQGDAPMKNATPSICPKKVADRFDAVAKVLGAKSALVEKALDRQLDPDRVQRHDEALLRRMDGVVKGFLLRCSATRLSPPRRCRSTCATSSPSRHRCRRSTRMQPGLSAASASRCSWRRSGAASPAITGSSPRCIGEHRRNQPQSAGGCGRRWSVEIALLRPRRSGLPPLAPCRRPTAEPHQISSGG